MKRSPSSGLLVSTAAVDEGLGESLEIFEALQECLPHLKLQVAFHEPQVRNIPLPRGAELLGPCPPAELCRILSEASYLFQPQWSFQPGCASTFVQAHVVRTSVVAAAQGPALDVCTEQDVLWSTRRIEDLTELLIEHHPQHRPRVIGPGFRLPEVTQRWNRLVSSARTW